MRKRERNMDLSIANQNVAVEVMRGVMMRSFLGSKKRPDAIVS